MEQIAESDKGKDEDDENKLSIPISKVNDSKNEKDLDDNFLTVTSRGGSEDYDNSKEENKEQPNK